MNTVKVSLPVLALVAALLTAPAYAHGFGERYDLPVPLGYFMVGAAAAVVLSFALMGVVVRGELAGTGYPRFNIFRYSWAQTLLEGPVAMFAQGFSLFLLLLVITTGLFGAEQPIHNFTPTFVWVIWWVGMGFFSALMGNIWALVNPWKILFSWVEAGHQRTAPEGELGLGWEYPEKWGIWPAVLLYLAFAWVENAFAGSSNPYRLATMVLAYSVITLGGMFLFGKHQWLRHGEAFSVVFGYLARFSITEVRVNDHDVCLECSEDCRQDNRDCVDCYECFEYAAKREFNLRPPAVGLNRPGGNTGDVTAMVILLLATVTFDGLSATPEWVRVQGYFNTQMPGLTSEVANGATIANSLGLIGAPLAFAGFYMGFSYLMHRTVGGRTDTVVLAKTFVFTLLPIAVAYNYAHFLSLLLIQGQLIIPLVSDPFGAGWDLFGTADYLINIRITNARFIWFFSVAVIVVGHMVAVYLAHMRAVLLYRDRELVVKSQVPMLGLMVIYTMISLWIISRPIVE